MAQLHPKKEKKTKKNCFLQAEQDTFVLGVLLMEIFHCFLFNITGLQ
jgi:hypothetical protein